MENKKNNSCPLCNRHCSLDAPQCKRGERYEKSEDIYEHTSENNPRDYHGYPEKRSHYRDSHTYQKANREKANFKHNKYKPDAFQETYDQLPTEEKILYNMGTLINFFRNSDHKHGQKRILSILNENGSMSQRQLMELAGIKPGSLSEILGKLEINGDIIRSKSEYDHRLMIVTLTDAGKNKVQQTHSERKTHYEELFSCLENDDKNHLLSLLEQLAKAWQQPTNPQDDNQ